MVGSAKLVAAETPVAVGDAASFHDHVKALADGENVAEGPHLDIAVDLLDALGIARVAACSDKDCLGVVLDDAVILGVPDEHAGDGLAVLDELESLAVGLEHAAVCFKLGNQRLEAAHTCDLGALVSVQEAMTGTEAHTVGVDAQVHVDAVIDEVGDDALTLIGALAQKGAVHGAAAEAVLALIERLGGDGSVFLGLDAGLGQSRAAGDGAVGGAAGGTLFEKNRLLACSGKHQSSLKAGSAAADHDGFGVHGGVRGQNGFFFCGFLRCKSGGNTGKAESGSGGNRAFQEIAAGNVFHVIPPFVSVLIADKVF